MQTQGSQRRWCRMTRTLRKFESEVVAVLVFAGTAGAQPYTTLASGYTQRIFGVASSFLGGVAFAPNGDVLADACSSSSNLFRFALGTTITVNGSTIHPQAPGSPVAS